MTVSGARAELRNATGDPISTMNAVMWVLFGASALTFATSVPLLQGRIKRNEVYGIKVAAAYESEDAWQRINQAGARVMMRFSFLLFALALAGLFFGTRWRLAYNWTVLVLAVLGVLWTLRSIVSSSRRSPPE